MRFLLQSSLLTCTALTLLGGSRSEAQTYVDGIDVSIFQKAVRWQEVRDSGVEFAFIRATRGQEYVDPLFLANMRGATKGGVLTGVYHYCFVDSDTSNPQAPVIEANHFLDTIKPYYDAGMMFAPVADVESFDDLASLGYTTQAQQRTFVSNWTQKFSDTIYDAIGVRPIIYSGQWAGNYYFTPQVASSHDRWLAWYRGTGTTQPPQPQDTPSWNPWSFWQYSSTGRIDGIGDDVDVDLNVFNGNRAQLEAKLVGNGPLGALPGGRIVLTGFDGGDQEGYMGQLPTYSGSSSGIGTVTADRVTTQSHEGTGSQRIAVTPSSTTNPSWFLRFVSGLGATPSTPEANLALETTGSVGFWLKTSNSGLSAQLAIDDSDGTERSITRSVVGDNQWHLYEWNFDDASQWNSWLSGSNGTINGATATIDSLMFYGSGASTLYIDTIAHNPNGSLTPISGDFTRDWLIDSRDLDVWKASLGVNAAGDANNDGVTDGSDFLTWQRNLTPAAAVPAAAAVPEPGSLTLICCAAALGWRHRRRAG